MSDPWRAHVEALISYWLPPREVEWLREVKRQRYIPQPDRKRRKKRTA